jgi:nitrile hydratase subunit beta
MSGVSKATDSAMPSCYGVAMETNEHRAHHDLGGVPKFLHDKVDIEPHDRSDFDRQVDALVSIVRTKRLLVLDEFRRGVEAIPVEAYHRLSYHTRSLRSLTDNLIRKGLVTEAELQAALGVA